MESTESSEALAILDQDILGEVNFLDAPTHTYGDTSDKNYDRLVRARNVTSYSQSTALHACPRKFLANKVYAAKKEAVVDGVGAKITNIHFAFGHAVGAGVQSLLIHQDLDIALFQAFMAWQVPFTERLDKKKKSMWEAVIAIEKFSPWYAQLNDDWELLYLPNGKPAIEVNFSLDCNNGYKHYGHIDGILRNKRSGQIAVLELKTTGFTSAEEAIYANSSQALSYSVVLDAIFPGIQSYEVFHCVYSSTGREWSFLPFPKSISQKAEWIKDLLLDHSVLDTYYKLKFFPMRGESCFNYNQRCEFFGSCNMIGTDDIDSLRILPMHQEVERVDYALNLGDIIRAQQEKL